MSQPHKPVETTARKTKAQRALERRQRNYLIFSVVMVGVLALSALAPLFMTTVQPPQPDIQPTATPAPLLPTPIADLTTITFDTRAMNASGLYSVAIPTGWEVSANFVQLNEAPLTQRNAAASSVIETRLIRPEPPITDVEGVRAFFSEAWLRSSWRDYTSWDLTGDTVVGDRYIADFVLTRAGSEFIARQEAWTDGTYLYVVRVVALPDAADMLRHVLDGVRASIALTPQAAEVPFDWQSSHDTVTSTLIRFPAAWRVTDSAPGQPTSIEGEGAAIRVETLGMAIATEADARAWVETTYGAVVSSVTPVTRGGSRGFAVAYQVVDFDGGSSSGYAVLLTHGERTSVANLRFNASGVDLNRDATGHETWRQIMDTFTLVPPASPAL